MSEFQNVNLSDTPKVRVRKLGTQGKMTKVEIQMEIDLPTSVIKDGPDGISLPLWAIKNAMK